MQKTPYLPALMTGAGYATAGFVSTLYVSKIFGFQRGFDKFDDFGIETEKENQRGETVMSLIALMLVFRREAPASS